ncbi:MAG: ABC transporter permease [Planctomycetota bacterium]|jgi:putative ABC transport system permease protein
MHRFRAIRNVELGIKSLMLHKLRSLLTVLGVVFGVGSVIAVLAIGEGVSQEAEKQIKKLGSNNIILQAAKPIEEDKDSANQAHTSVYGLLYEDEERIRNSICTIELTVPAKIFREDGRLGERSLEVRVVGTTPEWFTLVQRELLAGRLLTQRDMDERAMVCVLTENDARNLLPIRHTIGQTVRIGRMYYEVVGVVRSEQASGSLQTPDRNVDAYIPLNVARDRYGDMIELRTEGSRQREEVQLHQILVRVDSDEHVESTAEALDALMARFHKRKDYVISVPLSLLREARATKRRNLIMLAGIAGISLVVGGIGIMNIMLATVTERTREIGIRRAIGAHRRQIVGQFLIETIVLTTVGGMLGVAVGVLVPKVIVSYIFGMPTIIPLYSLVLSIGISLGVGLIFGLYPAIRAANLDPISALRHE